jgi:hypothetical protein
VPRIPDQLLQAVVYVYPSAASAMDGRAAGGTGFFVDLRSQISGQASRYVITNRHVAQGESRFLRINTSDGGTDVLEIPALAWVGHPDGDDIAAAGVSAIGPEWAISALDFDSLAVTTPRMEELNMGVGDEVFMLGRFISHGGIRQNQPLARFGNIAMMPGEGVLDGRQMRVEAFLVEMRSLSGFSGSPVFVYMGPATYRGDGRMMPFYSETIGLMGIDTGHKLMTSTIIDRTTGQQVDPNWTVEHNTGISIVAPVWKIREVLEEDQFRKSRVETDRLWLETHGSERASTD